MDIAYWVITFILYIIGIIVWIAIGTAMNDGYDKPDPEDWRVWRGAFAIGIFSIWLWPLLIPLAILILLLKCIRDALWTVFKARKHYADQ